MASKKTKPPLTHSSAHAQAQPSTSTHSPGTAFVPFAPTLINESDFGGQTTTGSLQNITAQQPFLKFSPEELRLADYQAGRRFIVFGNINIGNASTTGSVQANNMTSSLFGSNNSGGGTLFGTKSTVSLFGNSNPANTPATSKIKLNNATSSSTVASNSPGFSGGLFGNNGVVNTGTSGINKTNNTITNFSEAKRSSLYFRNFSRLHPLRIIPLLPKSRLLLAPSVRSGWRPPSKLLLPCHRPPKLP